MGRIGKYLQRNAIALLALFLALGGTTYAASSALGPANSVASPQVVNGSLKVVDFGKSAKKALRGARGARGAAGAAGTAGAKGATGAQGVQGVQGVAGTARAYAEVDYVAPSFVTARTKGFTGVTRPGTGIYCLTLDPALGLDARSVATVATVDYGASANTKALVEVRGSGFGCPAGSIEVETFVFDNATDPALASTVTFHVIVP